ncbi:MAG: hypothetical protein IRZ15_03190 [Bryobacteraceae bacterium]|nr:hypothetical protein [Bryobacteraceae bacterium]
MQVIMFLFLMTLGALAQDGVRPGFFEGELLEREGTASEGTLTVREQDNKVYRCSFDSKTYIEHSRHPASAMLLKAGDHLLLLAERNPGNSKCYIRALRVMEAPAKAEPRPSQRVPMRKAPRATTSYALESLFPRGNLTFAGVVVRRSPERIILRTRSGEEQSILLREDTRFLGSGLPVNADDLPLNSWVFVRAGRNFDNEVEAFQVVWGEILQPK